MKTKIYKAISGRKFILVLSFVVVYLLTASNAFAQTPPPPPPPGGGSGGNNNQPGGGAPIGGGLGILLALGAAYGARKIYFYKQKLEE